MKPVPLTKTRFATALECPRRLNYERDSRYADAGADDEFLQSLAEGGQQVGALARLMFAGGIEIVAAGADEQVEATSALLARDEVTIFEAAIRHGNLLVRCDVLRKSGSKVELIEVKAKGYRAGEDKFLAIKKGEYSVPSKWVPYIYDVAYQAHVLRLAFPRLALTPYLMLLEKTVSVSLAGLCTSIRIEATGRRLEAIIDPAFDVARIDPPILRMIDVTDAVSTIWKQPLDTLHRNQSFVDFVGELANGLANGTPFPITVGSQCGDCQFYVDPSEVSPERRSGWGECMASHSKDAKPLSRDESIFNLRRLQSKGVTDLLRAQSLRIGEVAEASLPKGDTAKAKISQEHRRHLQWREARGTLKDPYKLDDELKAEFARWRWPLHFIDFETSRPALPYHSRRTPYDQIFFQFSHHILDRGGRLSHQTQFIQADPGVPPSVQALRALRNALSSDDGSAIHWWTHEDTVLKEIHEQLMLEPTEDATQLSQFVESMVGQKDVQGRLVDLGRLLDRAVFLPGTNGRSSIKRVLPAILKHSEPLRRRYGVPIYGTPEMPSLNFSNWQWVVSKDGRILDPYALLDPLFADKSLDRLTRQAEGEERAQLQSFVANGGAAIIAYDQLQQSDLPSAERDHLRNQLLRYCELDTLAMVMVYQALALHGLEQRTSGPP